MASILSQVNGESPYVRVIGAALFVLAVAFVPRLWHSFRVSRLLAKYPHVNKKWNAAAARYFEESADKLIEKGTALAKGKPFRLNDKGVDTLVIPPKYIDEVKNDSRLDFHTVIAKDFHSHIPGFDPFGVALNQDIFQNAVRQQLTQALTMTIEPLAEETPHTLDVCFGPAPEWKETLLNSSLLRAVARLTSRIFLGPDFMNNPDWQRVSVMYTVDSFIAAQALNKWPAYLRPIVHWFMPEVRKLREEVKLVRELVTPEVTRRRQELIANGGKPRRKVLDSVDWFTNAAKGRDFDYPMAELSLAMASIHTTNSTVCSAMYDLITHPQYFEPLRKEIKEVYAAEGGKWEKSTLFKMQLMDSFLKESMRCHPHAILTMPRQANVDITLSDGLLLPKDTFFYIGPHPVFDPKIYPEPDKFDAYRFVKKRNEPGAENKYQLVTTGPEMTVFGHGQHACPGRFFASNEMKLLMAHLIMYYDWKLPDGQTKVQPVVDGIGRTPPSTQKVLFKSRVPEISR